MVVIQQDKIVEKSSDYIVVGGGASGCALTNKLLKYKTTFPFLRGACPDIKISLSMIFEGR